MKVAELPETHGGASSAVDHTYLIIGAGFGGMGIAIQLRREGIDDLLIIDREDGVGGTWHINTYPGLAVDIASVTYSFSFEPNPGWSRLYAPGAELKAYAEHVVDRYDLRRHLRLSTSVAGVEWDEAGSRWIVRIDGDEPVTCRYLVMATGFLSQPKTPDIEGLEDFAGKVVHTARWDHDHDLTGRRVAVIGTGATSVQLLPEIAPIVDHLDVYQRTPIWCVPKLDGTIPGFVRALFRHLPLTQRLARHANSAVLESLVVAALYNRQLPQLTAMAERLGKANIRRHIADRDMRRALTPDYELGCKRPTFSNTYYPTFNRPNVALVTDPIQRITPTGIVTADGTERPIDTLVLATGFKLMEEGNYPPFPVTGRDGRDLAEQWRTQRFTSYEGIAVHGYPNLHYLPAPYTYSGLSYFFTIEAQMAHVSRLVRHMRREGVEVFEATAEAEQAYVAKMRAAASSSIFVSGDCGTSNSYYFNEHGEAAIARLAPTAAAGIRARTFDLNDYAYGSALAGQEHDYAAGRERPTG